MWKTDYIRGKVNGVLHVISVLSDEHQAGYHSSLCPFCEMSPNVKHWRGKWSDFHHPDIHSLSLDGMLAVDLSPPGSSVVPSLALECTVKARSLNGALLFASAHTALLYHAQLCVSFLKRFTMKAGVAAPSLHYRSEELPNCRRMCEWKSSFCSSPASRVHCARRRWVVGVLEMARELKWNSQILPPTCRSLIKAPVLFSLAICLLHVSMIVKLCVICCDSFIILESTDVALLSLQIEPTPNSFSVAVDKCMQRSSERLMTSLTSPRRIF